SRRLIVGRRSSPPSILGRRSFGGGLDRRRNKRICSHTTPRQPEIPYSARQPEIAWNDIVEPFQIRWQLAAFFRRIEWHNEQVRLHPFHEIRRGEPGVTANATHFDRHIGLTKREDEMFQFCVLVSFRG